MVHVTSTVTHQMPVMEAYQAALPWVQAGRLHVRDLTKEEAAEMITCWPPDDTSSA